MFTQCRGCGEIFKIEVDDLVAASAMVRCSTCGAVFNSLDTLSDYKPQQSTHLILHENDNSPPLLTHEFKKNTIKQKVTTANVESEKQSNRIIKEKIAPNVEFMVKPDFVADTPIKSSKFSIFIWIVATILLIMLMLWQSTKALKNGSLQLPEGTVKEEVCHIVDCYKQKTQPGFNNIALVSRNIRQHGGRDNALIITTGMINSDDKIQKFPALQVKMSNLNGETVAMRRFLPHEYLDDETLKAGMMPNILIPIQLELKSPGKNAVTFEVNFSQLHDAQY